MRAIKWWAIMRIVATLRRIGTGGLSREGISASWMNRSHSIQPVWLRIDYRLPTFNLIYYMGRKRRVNLSQRTVLRLDWPAGRTGQKMNRSPRSLLLFIHTFLLCFLINEVVFGIIIEFRQFVTNIDEPEAHRRGWLRRVIKCLYSESNFIVFSINFRSYYLATCT